MTFPLDDSVPLTGFPGPLQRGSEGHAKRWSRLRIERLLNEDVCDLRNVGDLNALHILVDLLLGKVGSQLSVNSLREGVGGAYGTVRDWMLVLEAPYICFTIRPFSGKLKRSLTAEPKLYLYEFSMVESLGAKLETFCACHLLKLCQYWTNLAMG